MSVVNQLQAAAGWGAVARIWLQRAYLAALFLTTLAYGSASTFGTALATFNFSLLTLAAFAIPMVSPRVRKIEALAGGLALALFAYALVQALPLGVASPFAHPAWRLLDARVGGGRGFISVAPGMTLAALPALALPFLAFLSALRLFQSDDEAGFLWRALAAFGTACAVYGLVQEEAFPQALLFETKTAYRGSLTSTFVNRNTAGAFFGVALLLNLSLLIDALNRVRLRTLWAQASNFQIRWRSHEAVVLLYLGCATTAAVALLLTQSRGAVGATFVACLLAVALPATRQPVADVRGGGRAVAALVGVACVFVIFGGKVLFRLQEQGVEDARWCAFASTWQAIRDNWRLGAGFGAFQDIFPRYRHANCGSGSGSARTTSISKACWASAWCFRWRWRSGPPLSSRRSSGD